MFTGTRNFISPIATGPVVAVKVIRVVGEAKPTLSSVATTTVSVPPEPDVTCRPAYNVCVSVGPVKATTVPDAVVDRVANGWSTTPIPKIESFAM